MVSSEFEPETRPPCHSPRAEVMAPCQPDLAGRPASCLRSGAGEPRRCPRGAQMPDGPAAESALYHDTTARLTALGWPVCSLDSTARTPGDVAAIVTQRILTLHADRSAHGNQRPVIPDVQHR